MTCLCGAKEFSLLCTLGTDSSNSSLSKNSSASSNDSVIYRPNGADSNADSCTNSPVSLLRLPKVILRIIWSCALNYVYNLCQVLHLLSIRCQGGPVGRGLDC